MANQSPPPPTGLPNNPPTTPFNSLNSNLWSVPAGQLQLISPYSTPHPLVSSGTPLIITYPAAQQITPGSQPSPSSMLTPAETSQTTETSQQAETTQPTEEPKNPRRGGKRTSKKGAASSKRKTLAPATTTVSPAEDKSSRKQRSWEKDVNSDGKTMVNLIVEWLCLTWGDQEKETDGEWMCMESTDTISTNYARFRMGLPGKKECARRCALFIGANGFDTPTWDGVKQKIDSLETKFKDAQRWTKQTGEGGGLAIDQNADVEIEVLRSIGDWTEEREQEIRTMAAQTTKECLHSRCSHYDILNPIMADRAGNEPLYTAESGVDSQTTSNNQSGNPPSPLTQAEEPQSTQFAGWDPTQPLEVETNDSEDPQPSQDIRSSSSRPIERSSSSQLLFTSKTLPRPNMIQHVKSISDNPRRTSGGTLGVLKSFQSSLPTQADYEKLRFDNMAAAESNRVAFEQATSNSNAVMKILEHRFGNPNQSEKHLIDPEDLTPEAVEKKKAKKAMTEELEMLKLERELAQERRALVETTAGSGLSKLQLAREKAEMISKFCLANISLETAREMAQEIIDSLK
ncbi:hypothetical protein DFH28DRAFT_1120590 [Melampsora americana]|nr:hypothetical protein DFH28DRAFT_1120590 [Melampsora americana]